MKAPSAAALRFHEVARQCRLAVRHLRHAPALVSARARASRADELVELFCGVNRFLEASQAPYAIHFGTLLGWFREGRLLAHDKDVDFCAPVGAYGQIVSAARSLPRGYRLHDTSARHFGPKLYVTHRGWEADIYFLVEEQGFLRCTERSRNPGDSAPFPRDWFYPLQPAELHGQATRAPARPREILQNIYHYLGPDAVRDPVTRYFRPRTPRA